MPYIQDSHISFSSFVKTHIDIPDYVDSSLSLHTIMRGIIPSSPLTSSDEESYTQASFGTLSTSQALALARESEEPVEDPVVIDILEIEINKIWTKINKEPTTYVMTNQEFAVFNYFQNRFQGQELATSARRRYWDSN